MPYNASKVLRYGMCYQDQFYLPPTCAPTNGMSHLAFTPQLRSITILWPVLISHPAVGRRLSWRLSDHLTNTMHIVVAVAFPRLESFPAKSKFGQHRSFQKILVLFLMHFCLMSFTIIK